MADQKPKLVITLNGTTVNPYHQLGLKANPFPDETWAGLNHDLWTRFALLEAEPIPNADYIKNLLRGYVTDEFLDGLAERFEPGVMKTLYITWPDSEDRR